jgi:hypothetical protein
MDVQEFRAELFRPHVGSEFQLTTQEGQAHSLLLNDVKVVLEKSAEPRITRDAFSLYFVGSELYLPQHIYSLSHVTLGGPWDVFIVPVGRTPQGAHIYEAAFN